MGYDMRFLTEPTGERERVQRAREIWDSIIAYRDALPREERGRHTEEEFRTGRLGAPPANATPRYKAAQCGVMAISDLIDAEEISYFRLNIWGMGRVRDVMLRLDMCYGSGSEMSWPPWNRFANDEARQEQFEVARGHFEHGEELPDGIPDEVLSAAREHVEQVRACRRHHPAGGDTIPLHKFGSNDGWIVTPEECKAALAAYESTTEDRRTEAFSAAGMTAENGWTDYWAQWIAYLRSAIDHDGFAVW
jgi:hypothetical protein